MAADQPKLKEGTGFVVLADPDETWKKIRDCLLYTSDAADE